MVLLRYVGKMSKGMAVAPGFRRAVVKGETYDVPDNVAEKFLVSKDWENASPKKKKDEPVVKTEEKIEAPIEVLEENIVEEIFEEDE